MGQAARPKGGKRKASKRPVLLELLAAFGFKVKNLPRQPNYPLIYPEYRYKGPWL